MKNFLVTLLLTTGLVSVASAVQHFDCTYDPTANQCCIDYTDMNNILANKTITSTDNFVIFELSSKIVDVYGYICRGNFGYVARDGVNMTGPFTWTTGNWTSTIAYYPFDKI